MTAAIILLLAYARSFGTRWILRAEGIGPLPVEASEGHVVGMTVYPFGVAGGGWKSLANLLGKCGGCGAKMCAADALRVQVTVHSPKHHRRPLQGCEAAISGDKIYMMSAAGNYIGACACGTRVVLKRVQGVFRADKGCNGKCMASTGPSCECACGGHNHGRNNV